jgi:hypothetical protein
MMRNPSAYVTIPKEIHMTETKLMQLVVELLRVAVAAARDVIVVLENAGVAVSAQVKALIELAGKLLQILPVVTA